MLILHTSATVSISQKGSSLGFTGHNDQLCFGVENTDSRIALMFWALLFNIIQVLGIYCELSCLVLADS